MRSITIHNLDPDVCRMVNKQAAASRGFGDFSDLWTKAEALTPITYDRHFAAARRLKHGRRLLCQFEPRTDQPLIPLQAHA